MLSLHHGPPIAMMTSWHGNTLCHWQGPNIRFEFKLTKCSHIAPSRLVMGHGSFLIRDISLMCFTGINCAIYEARLTNHVSITTAWFCIGVYLVTDVMATMTRANIPEHKLKKGHQSAMWGYRLWVIGRNRSWICGVALSMYCCLMKSSPVKHFIDFIAIMINIYRMIQRMKSI